MNNPIDPHVFSPSLMNDVTCYICGLNKYRCEMMYKPRQREAQCCTNFVGLRQWGIHPEPWRTCQNCGWPKAEHDVQAKIRSDALGIPAEPQELFDRARDALAHNHIQHSIAYSNLGLLSLAIGAAQSVVGEFRKAVGE